MIDVTFTLNGVNYSQLLSTYSVTHVVEYPTTVTAIDGTEYGYGRRRPTITFSLIPLTDAQSATLYDTLLSTNVLCVYTDPQLGRTASASMRVTSNIESVFGLRSVDGNRYYKGGQITLRQRTVL